MPKAKLKKPFELRVKDLLDYHQCLGEDIREYENGKVHRLKTILCSLRVLVCDNNGTGLAFIIAKQWKIPPAVTFHGMVGFPHTNPRSKDRTVTLKEYINDLEPGCMPTNGVAFTNKQLITEYANQDGAHSDPRLAAYILEKDAILIGGINALDRQIICIAKGVFLAIEAMVQQAIQNGTVIKRA